MVKSGKMVKKYRHISTIIDISDKEIKRIHKELSLCLKNSKTFEELFKKALKIARNEEEMKYILFRLGQLEHANFTLTWLKNIIKKEQNINIIDIIDIINKYTIVCINRIGIWK